MKYIYFIFCISILNHSYAQNPKPKETKEKPIGAVELVWEEVEGAKGYEIEIQNDSINKKYQSTSPVFNIQIPIGNYKARGRTKDHRGVFGEWSEYVDFEAIPQAVDLKSSFEQFPPVVKMERYLGIVRIKWKPLPSAKSYKFYLKDMDGKIRSVHETKTSYVVFKTKPGKYKYNVTAFYSGKLESTPAEYEPFLELSGTKLETPRIISTPIEEQVGQIKYKTDNPQIQLMAKIEYSAFLSDEWQTLKDEKINLTFFTQTIKKPGKYRIGVRSTMANHTDSDPIYRELLIKPKDEDLK